MLRRRLELAKRGLTILQMRREMLARELVLLLSELRRRREAEEAFARALQRAAELRASRGEIEFRSMASLAKPPRIELVAVSYQGVPVRQARVAGEPDLSAVHDPEFREVAEELWRALAGMIEVANVEEAAAEVGKQLVSINQVANSLERSVIPSLEDAVKRVEEWVANRELEDFVRARRLRGD
jgi:V/A-type H+-transporting ATPase subunit D